ncbi:hypothetical protein T07_2160 [Trichinella nelsoni]|uniref:Uncharacterized protein n=1 Tax=Trichinella nelsoni TaxID=6336 RepID=A0A0V0S919_9BILA|nr:hypothetical protein T07_2160 [Trichinella nelsoni]
MTYFLLWRFVNLCQKNNFPENKFEFKCYFQGYSSFEYTIDSLAGNTNELLIQSEIENFPFNRFIWLRNS